MNKKNQQKNMLKYSAWIPAIFMMIVIFKFSAANGTESSGTSTGMLEHILTGVSQILRVSIPIHEKLWLLDVLETPLRKCAHMTEYMCLALTVMFPFYVFEKRGKKLVFSTALVSILYACTDEFHQYFVPGRASRVTDVLIDSIGVWIGIGIGIVIFGKIYKWKEKNKKLW